MMPARSIERAHADDLAAHYHVLAQHYAEAAGAESDDHDTTERAVRYLEAAGTAALRDGAFPEAARHLRSAIELHERLPRTQTTLEDELRLREALALAVFTTSGYGSPEALETYERALAVAEGKVEEARLFVPLWGLWIASHFTKDVQRSLLLGDRLMGIAERSGDPELELQAHHALWTSLMQIPDYERARRHLERGEALYQPGMHESHCVRFGGHDPGACAQRALALSGWTMGQPDRALHHAYRGIELGRRHDFTVATSQLAAAFVHRQRGEVDDVERVATELIERARAHGLSGFTPWARLFLAWVRGQRGELGRGIETMVAIRAELSMLDPPYMSMLTELLLEDGQHERAAELLGELSAEVERKAERAYQPELLRMHAQVHEARGDRDAAEASLQEALALARRQGALSFELRAATDLATLDASQMPTLRAVFERFDEGFETRDLRRARALLDTSP